MDRLRQADLIAVGVMALPLIASVAFWSSLPTELAIHWDAAGVPDSYVSKPMATGGLFAFGVVIVVFTRLAPSSMTNTPGGTDVSILFIGIVFAYVQSLVLVWNLGYTFDVWLALLPLFLLVVLIVIYSLMTGRR